MIQDEFIHGHWICSPEPIHPLPGVADQCNWNLRHGYNQIQKFHNCMICIEGLIDDQQGKSIICESSDLLAFSFICETGFQYVSNIDVSACACAHMVHESLMFHDSILWTTYELT